MDLLNKIQIGKESSSQSSFRTLGGIKSGPCDLFGLSWLNFSLTAFGVSLKSVIHDPFDLDASSKSGKFDLFSLVNTLAKNEFNASAFSRSSVASLPSFVFSVLTPVATFLSCHYIILVIMTRFCF